MLNQRSFLRIGIVLFSMIFILASFGTVCAKEKKEIVIGTHLSLTGMLAMSGAEQRWSYEQSVADINKKGGILPPLEI